MKKKFEYSAVLRVSL